MTSVEANRPPTLLFSNTPLVSRVTQLVYQPFDLVLCDVTLTVWLAYIVVK